MAVGMPSRAPWPCEDLTTIWAQARRRKPSRHPGAMTLVPAWRVIRNPREEAASRSANIPGGRLLSETPVHLRDRRGPVFPARTTVAGCLEPQSRSATILRSPVRHCGASVLIERPLLLGLPTCFVHLEAITFPVTFSNSKPSSCISHGEPALPPPHPPQPKKLPPDHPAATFFLFRWLYITTFWPKSQVLYFASVSCK